MTSRSPRRPARASVSFWMATVACIAILAFSIFVSVGNAQQGSQSQTHKKSQTASSATSAKDKAKDAQASGAQQGSSEQGARAAAQDGASQPQVAAPTTGQVPASSGGQTAAPAAQDPAQGGSQQPFVMPDKPLCPCPLVTKDSVEPHFQEICGRCHTPDRITGIKKSGLEWKETIEKMILKGAQVSDQDYDVILAFLVRNFDRVDINWVDSGELVVALGLTPQEAENIIAYRKANGDFKDFDQLTKIPGVDVKKLEAKKSSFMFY